MKVLVSDFGEQMEADYQLTKEAVWQIFNEAEIVVEPYGTDVFFAELEKADGLITAFLPIDEAFLEKAPNLKYISINAAGYSNVDLKDTNSRGIKVCHISEYCTREVSEHTLSMAMALNNNLKIYGRDVARGNWNYGNAPMRPTLDSLTVVIFGFGKIGRCTSRLLGGLGCQVCFVDPYVGADAEGARKVEIEQVYELADVIINHMALTDENYHMFDYDFFKSCKKQPIFINVGRGGCVDEDGLLSAISDKLIYAAGLDVLEDENPNMKESPLAGLENVLLTPHAAFYSANSMRRLHEISGGNMGYMLAGEDSKTKELI